MDKLTTIRLFELIEGNENRAVNRHTEVVQRLTALETKQAKQPCTKLKEHLKDHKEIKSVIRNSAAQIIVTAVLSAGAALLGMLWVLKDKIK